MKYSICHPRDIQSTAQRLTLQLLPAGDNLSVVLDLILSTATSNPQYTRSLALVAKRIVDNLKARGSDATAALFREQLGDMSLAIFIRRFTDPFEAGEKTMHISHNIVLSVMPLAISAFVGDLTSVGLITFTAFDACMGFLMKRIKTRLHIRSLKYLLRHAGARHLPQVTVSYVRECAKVVRKRADQHLQCYSLEEDDLRELMEDIVTRPVDAYYREEWDRRLDLEMALQASVLDSPLEDYRAHTVSPSGSESGSSARTNSIRCSPRSKANSLTVSPATSVESTKNNADFETRKVAVVSHSAFSDDILSLSLFHEQLGGKSDSTNAAPTIIHAPRPVHPVQFLLRGWFL